MRSPLVLGEIAQGLPTQATVDALSLGSQLRKEDQKDLHIAFVTTEPISEKGKASLTAHGVSHVYYLAGLSTYSEKAVSTSLTSLVNELNPMLVLSPVSPQSRDVLPQIAVHSNRHVVTEVLDMKRHDDQNIAITRPLYTGKLSCTILTSEPLIVSLRARAERREHPQLRPHPLPLKEKTINIAEINPSAILIDILQEAEEHVDLQTASVIVSGGRGLGGPENWHILERFAKCLGAATGASRAVVDAGWRPHSEQVGQTGKVVQPKLYIAVGISGAIQHLVGIQNAQFVIAINKDPQAPIFNHANYGMIGDALEILPKLSNAIEAHKKS